MIRSTNVPQSKYDRYCPLYKTSAMLRNMMTYYNLAIKAVESGQKTWSKVRDATGDVWHLLSQQKFEDPADGQETLQKRFDQTLEKIEQAFSTFAILL